MHAAPARTARIAPRARGTPDPGGGAAGSRVEATTTASEGVGVIAGPDVILVWAGTGVAACAWSPRTVGAAVPRPGVARAARVVAAAVVGMALGLAAPTTAGDGVSASVGRALDGTVGSRVGDTVGGGGGAVGDSVGGGVGWGVGGGVGGCVGGGVGGSVGGGGCCVGGGLCPLPPPFPFPFPFPARTDAGPTATGLGNDENASMAHRSPMPAATPPRERRFTRRSPCAEPRGERSRSAAPLRPAR